MSTQSVTVRSDLGTSSPHGNASTRARVTAVAVALTLGSSLVISMLLWHPWPDRDDISYGAFAPIRDTAWLGLILDSIGYATAGIALGVAVCLLVRERGAFTATMGAALVALGGALFAAGSYSLGVLGWYATATDAIPVASGTSLMTYVDHNLAHVAAMEIAGFLMFNIGLLLLAVALRRSSSVPGWLPIALGVLTVAQFVVPPTRALDILQSVHMATFIAVAWFLRRTVDGRSPARATSA